MKTEINPIELLNPKRFDIIPKYLYGKYREMGIKSDWAKKLYSEHILVFNKAYEPYPKKKGVKEFLAHFEKILDSIKNEGFNEKNSAAPVVVGKDGAIFDGSHRVAACLVYGKPIKVIKKDKNGPDYNYAFFKNRIINIPTGLSEKFADSIALEYSKLKKNTHIVSVFPSAQGKDDEIKKSLDKYGKIVYEKKVLLNEIGQINLMRQMYSDEWWLGSWNDGFIGAKRKAKNCFVNRGHLRVFLYESENLDNVNKAKKEIRDLFRIGEHSVHINDTHQETEKLSKIFFNENSLHFINNSRLNYYKNFYKLLKEYKKWLKENKLDSDEFCIVGSGALAIYGIREAGDLDFMHFNESLPKIKIKKINSHNEEAKHYSEHKDEIIFNPENHFYFDGIKFISLELIEKMKERRGEIKDKIDLRLIKEVKNPTNIKPERDVGLNNFFKKIIETTTFQKINYLISRGKGIIIFKYYKSRENKGIK